MGRWVKAPTVMGGMLWPYMMKIKDFKLSPQAKGPSPLAPATAR